MKLKCNATGSKGNSYYIQADNSKILLIEAGVNERQMLTGVSLDLIEGLIISHNHKDHNCYTPNKITMGEKFANMGIPVYTCENIRENESIDLETFKIIPIEVEHDVKCFGFLILVDGKKILFATDSKMIPLIENVKIDYFIVECNYQLDLMLQKIDELIEDENANKYEIERYKRVYHNHCGLETLVDYFKGLGYYPKGIYTIHKSNSGLAYNEDIEETLRKYSDKVKVLEKGDKIKLC